MDLLKLLVKCGVEITDEVKEKIKQAQGTLLESYVKKTELEKKELELDAFKEQVNKLKQDKDALNTSLENSKKEFTDYKENLEKEKINTNKRELLQDQLKTNGLMNDKLIALLTKEIDLDTIEVKDGSIVDVSKIIDPIKSEYGDFFGEVENQGTPPKKGTETNGQVITLDTIKTMSTEEINKNWDIIEPILNQGGSN